MASQTSGLRRFSAGIPPPRKGSLYATNVQRGTDLQRGSVYIARSCVLSSFECDFKWFAFILKAVQEILSH